jgi:MFS family permease
VAATATVSSLGDWVNYGAVIALITFGDHDGATELALLALVMVIPTVVLSPLAGALADRVPLRRTMVACDLARVVVVATFVLAPDLWILFVLIALREVFSTLFTPAQQAYVALGVPPEDQVGVISLNQTGIQLSKIVGPGLGGLLYAIAGSHVAFGVEVGPRHRSRPAVAGAAPGRSDRGPGTVGGAGTVATERPAVPDPGGPRLRADHSGAPYRDHRLHPVDVRHRGL